MQKHLRNCTSFSRALNGTTYFLSHSGMLLMGLGCCERKLELTVLKIWLKQHPGTLVVFLLPFSQFSYSWDVCLNKYMHAASKTYNHMWKMGVAVELSKSGCFTHWNMIFGHYFHTHSLYFFPKSRCCWSCCTCFQISISWRILT